MKSLGGFQLKNTNNNLTHWLQTISLNTVTDVTAKSI